jgi:hypothetical protein
MIATPDGLAARRVVSLPWIDLRASRARIEVWVRVGEARAKRGRHPRPSPRPADDLAAYVVITREDLDSDLNYGRDE